MAIIAPARKNTLSASAMPLFEFWGWLPDEEAAIKLVERHLWNGAPTCQLCGSDKSYPIKRIKGHRCLHCRRNYTAKIGTIFEGSNLPMRKWLYAVHAMTAERKGVSPLHLSRELDITQKSAWFMLQRIKAACSTRRGVFDMVEIDETGMDAAEARKKRSPEKSARTNGKEAVKQTEAVLRELLIQRKDKRIKMPDNPPSKQELEKRWKIVQRAGRAPVIGRNKIGLDQFYTSRQVVKKCLARINLDDYDHVIEPGAGNGAFSALINHRHMVAMDIQPQSPSVMERDFFEYAPRPNHSKILVVGNPPFGVHHKLSDAFLKHAFSFSGTQTVAFILPNTYKKHTRQKIIPAEYRIKTIMDIGRNAFIHGGKPFHIPCSFFVFDKSKGKDLRFDPSKHQTPCDFDFGDRDNFDLFVFGANPAKFTKHPQPNNRGYFLLTRIKLPELCKRLQSVQWIGNSCASGGVAWLTKPEFVMLYNEKYGLRENNQK